MTLPFTRRQLALGSLTLAFALAAIAAGVVASSRAAQAQPNPSILSQQPPSSCACAPAVSIFGGSGGPQIASCQCGGLHCAAATAAGGVALQCAR